MSVRFDLPTMATRCGLALTSLCLVISTSGSVDAQSMATNKAGNIKEMGSDAGCRLIAPPPAASIAPPASRQAGQPGPLGRKQAAPPTQPGMIVDSAGSAENDKSLDANEITVR